MDYLGVTFQIGIVSPLSCSGRNGKVFHPEAIGTVIFANSADISNRRDLNSSGCALSET